MAKRKETEIVAETRRDINRQRVADMVLAGTPPEEIAEALGQTVSNVYLLMKEIREQTSEQTQEIAEKIRLINLARLERLISIYFMKALDNDMRSAELTMKMIKLEDDISGKDVAKEDGQRTAINIENIEVTMTAGSPMFKVAQSNMEDSWLNMADAPLSLIYQPDGSPIPALADEAGEKIGKLEELYGESIKDVAPVEVDRVDYNAPTIRDEQTGKRRNMTIEEYLENK